MNVQLAGLAAGYSTASQSDLVNLAREFDERRSREVLDVAALAADVAIDELTSLGLEPETNAALWRAFSLQYPHVDPKTLLNASETSLRGWINGVKGKYFEVLVERRLNEDRIFGELVLEPGQKAVLATLPNQKGWDLQILDEDGATAELIQLKAAELHYIKKAVENGFRVAITSEIDASSEEILGTPLSNKALEGETKATITDADQIDEVTETPLDDALDKLGEFGIDAVPVFAPVVIVFTEGRALLAGRATLNQALRKGARRFGTATAWSAVGSGLAAGLSAVDAGVISVPATVAARISWGRYSNHVARGAFLAPLNIRLADLKQEYAG